MFKILLLFGLLFYLLYHFSGTIMRFLFRAAGRELEKKVRQEQQKREGVVYQNDEVTIKKRPNGTQGGEYVDYEEV